jgi:PAS domain S-box-containing protein
MEKQNLLSLQAVGVKMTQVARKVTAQHGRTEETTRSAEEHYRAIFENSPVGIFQSTADGHFLRVNPAMAKIYGYASPKEMVTNIHDIARQIYVNPDERTRFVNPLNKQGVISAFVGENYRKDGSRIWTQTDARAIKGADGNILYYEGFITDITERRQVEQSLSQTQHLMRRITESSPNLIYLYDLIERRDIYANRRLGEMLGYTGEELAKISGKSFQHLMHPDDLALLPEWFQRYATLPNGKSIETEYRLRHADGEWHWFANSSLIFNRTLDGKPKQIIGTAQDITERKRADEKLRESEERFRSLYENSTIGLYRTTPGGKILLSNPAIVRMLGYSSFEELTQRNLEENGYEAGYERSEFQKQIERDGEVRGLESHWKRKDGATICVRESAKAIRDSDGRVLYYEGTVEDITEHKQAEEALRASENHFHTLFDNMLEGYAYCKMIYENEKPSDFIYLGVNNAFEKLTGLKEVAGKKVSEVIPGIQRSNPELFEIYGAVAFTGKSTKFETYVEQLKIWFSISVYSIEKGYFVAVFDNITKRKQAEEALRKSERVLLEAESLGHTGSWEQDLVTGEIFNTRENLRLFFGDNPGNKGGLFEDYSQAAHPGDREYVMRRHVQLLEGGPGDIEYRVVWPDGSVHWIFGRAAIVRDELGRAIRVSGTNVDITKRKQAEETLQNNISLLNATLESTADGILVVDKEGKVTTFNQKFVELWRIPQSILAAQFDEKALAFVIDQLKKPEEFLAQVQKLYSTPDAESFDVVELKDGRVFERYSKPQYLGTLSVGRVWSFRDITERKRTEKEIRESEQRFRSFIEASADGAVLIDEDEKIIEWNPMQEKITGISKAQAIDSSFADMQFKLLPSALRAGRSPKYFKDTLRIAFQRGEAPQLNKPSEVEIQTATGERKFLMQTAFPIKTEHGFRIGSVIRDITESKKAEAIIRQRLAELELIYQSGLEMSQILEPEEIAQRIIAQLESYLNWHHSAIRLYEPESQTLKIIGFNVPGIKEKTERQGLEGHFNSLVQKPGDGLSGWVVQHAQTLRISDLKHDARYVETFPGLNSGLYIPIKTDDRVIGVISVENELPDAFSELDEQLVGTLANQAAIALENSRLNKETMRQLKRLQALHSIDLAIANSLDLNVTLEVLINQVVQQLGVDAAAVFLLRPDIRTLKYSSSKGFHTRLLENLNQNLFLDESLAGRAIFENHISGSPASQEPNDNLKEIWAAEGFQSIYAVPLLTKGELKGVLKVFYRSKIQPPAKGWMDFLETLAGQAAIAIENIQLYEGLQKSNMELSIAYDATIEGWSRAMDLRDEETEGHTKRVTNMTLQLAAHFGFSGEMLMHIRRGALLHDIGKLGVPDGILLKPDKLTDEEWVIMKKHPAFAFEMLSPIQYLNRAINIPYCHHEKWDGTGYPRGLSGEQIPLEARIFAVVDVWDALTSDRPYRKAWQKDEVMEHIQSLAGTHFDPAVVERFLELQKKENQ